LIDHNRLLAVFATLQTKKNQIYNPKKYFFYLLDILEVFLFLERLKEEKYGNKKYVINFDYFKRFNMTKKDRGL